MGPKKLSPLVLVVSIAIGMFALWAGAVPFVGTGNSAIGGWVMADYLDLDFGCQSGECHTCVTSLLSTCSACDDGEDWTCRGGSITIISASQGSGEPVWNGEPYCTSDIGVCDRASNASCSW